ncbi:hypothetical protein Tco_1083981 [Tanacetum coccineum]
MLVEMIAERKRLFTAQRAEQIRNKPPTRAQLRNKMVTYLKHMGKYTHSQMKCKSFEEIQKLYEREQKWINDFVPMDSELEVQRLKRAGQEVLEESVKYLIINWEVYSEDTRRYCKIIRVGNHTKAYQIFAEMLKKFDRDDLVKLWDLVKERFSTIEPTDDKEKEL